jgi:signal transduction histidine kinase/ActR/RegA family two-component response regulator
VRGRREIEAAFAGAPLGEALAGAASATDLVQRVVHHLAAAGAGSAAFAIPTDDGRHLLLTSEGARGAEAARLTTFPLSDLVPAARTIRCGEPLYLGEPGSADSPELSGAGAVACLPVPAGAGIGGALVLGFDEPGGFDDAERTALSALAREVGQALERARLVDAALTARRRLVTLAEASARFLEAGPDRSALLAAAARVVAEALGDPCLVDLRPVEGETGPWSRLHHPDPAARVALAAHADASRALADAVRDEVAEAQDTVFRAVLEPGAVETRAPGAAAWLRLYPVHGLLAAPLRLAATPFGTLAVLRHRPHSPYSADDRLLLEGLADRVAISVAYQRLAVQERRAARRHAQLAAAARAFSEAQGDLAEVRRTVAERGAAALGARFTLWGAGASGAVDSVAAHPAARGARGEDARTGEAAAASEAIRTGLPVEHPPGAGRGRGVARGVIAVPLRVEGRVEGALTASRRAGRRTFGRGEVATLADLAAHAGLALAHARKRGELEAERQRLADVLASAEGASRAKDEFIAMLSHELRNPLSPIVTALELMRLHTPAVINRERVVIERQVAHLVRLVDDLLDVSRVIRGKVRLERRPVALADILARAVEQASPLLEERRHELQVNAAEGLVLDGDAHRLAQVVANLLTNAAKYTDPGGHIHLRAVAEGLEVRLSVSDDGIGIAPVLLPRVFDLFVQGERNLDRAPGGLGIGLTIVRSLVDLHGGRVAVESAGRGQGSTFTVWLPLALAARAHRAIAATEPQRPPGRGVAVLVVDDNTDAAELLAEALRARGHDVQVAFDGPTALAAVEGAHPRVALLDLGLPVMDGFELARRLRERLGRVRLVAVTGYGQEPDRRASAQAGFDAHLVKPVDLDAICEVVERLAPTEGAAAAG